MSSATFVDVHCISARLCTGVEHIDGEWTPAFQLQHLASTVMLLLGWMWGSSIIYGYHSCVLIVLKYLNCQHELPYKKKKMNMCTLSSPFAWSKKNITLTKICNSMSLLHLFNLEYLCKEIKHVHKRTRARRRRRRRRWREQVWQRESNWWEGERWSVAVGVCACVRVCVPFILKRNIWGVVTQLWVEKLLQYFITAARSGIKS